MINRMRFSVNTAGASENKWLPVEDLPPAREIMTVDERLKLKKELTAARNR